MLSRIMPTYSLLVFDMTILRNSIRNGTEFFVNDEIPSDEILEGLYKLRILESEKLKTVFWNCMTWRFVIDNKNPVPL